VTHHLFRNIPEPGTGTCFAGERLGESDGRGWVRLLGELEPDPGRESKMNKPVNNKERY
jgi:hypothetical protein